MNIIKKYNLWIILTITTCIIILFVNSTINKSIEADIKNAINTIHIDIKKQEYNRAIDIYKKTITEVPKYKYNKFYDELIRMSNEIMNIPKGTHHVMDVLISIEKSKLISKDNRFKICSNLGTMYLIDKNYAKSSEYILNTLILAKDMNYKYEEAKSLIDLGILFSHIDGYEMGVKVIKKALNVKLNNKDEYEFIQMYANTNLAEIYLMMKDYKNCERCIKQVEANEDFIQNEKYKDLRILINTIKCNIYIHKGDAKSAKKHLDLSKELLKNNDSEYIIDIKENYLFSKAKYYEFLEKNEEAIQIYKEMLVLENTKGNKELYKKEVLERLVRLYDKTKQNELENNYMNELLKEIKNEENIRYRDYSNYIIEQAEEKYMVQQERDSIKILMAIILVGTVFIIYTYRLNKKRLNKMRYIALHDKLTGVYNRVYFDNEYKKFADSNRAFAILMIDIDNFKNANDTFGHQFGDEVLKSITNRIKSLLNENSKICRYGGEEFVIINTYEFKEEVYLIAELIRRAIENIEWNKDINITISIGVAYSEEHKEKTLKKADENLYIAKTNGKNKVVI
ncbi:tetratricopeptide repeat-containing diguanylate cyclase [Paraclostridium bifermentans]|uniref:tetratricopeptide repeat-containing diguanylate cyclase n=1 Tax=Paraclostridium bifermentans TaxID=1490 RepID=UPI00359C38B2